MQRVMHYDPAKGEPQVFRCVSKPARWRLDAVIRTSAEAEPMRIVVRVPDKLRIGEVAGTFLDEIAKHLPEGAPVHSASVDFWADV